ncbi:MAG: hypothetical protein AB1488_07710 [Nitrospirota bacterium]
MGFKEKELFKMAAKKEDDLEKEKLLAEIERLKKDIIKRKFVLVEDEFCLLISLFLNRIIEDGKE